MTDPKLSKKQVVVIASLAACGFLVGVLAAVTS